MGTRILSVEDDERIRQAVKLALEDEGWIVDEAESGEAAIDIFKRHPSDVVLIDIMLPGIDGFELCRTIRRTSDVPVVMVTARNDTHDIVAGLEAGADDYLTKPFAPKELSARIRALLRRTRPSSTPHARISLGDLAIVPDEGKVSAAVKRFISPRLNSDCSANLQTTLARCSAVKRSSTKCGAMTISEMAGLSTFTSVDFAPKLRPILQILGTS